MVIFLKKKFWRIYDQKIRKNFQYTCKISSLRNVWLKMNFEKMETNRILYLLICKYKTTVINLSNKG